MILWYSGSEVPSRWSIREIDGEFVVGEFYQEAMRIDSSGNLGIGTGKVSWSIAGIHKFKTREWAELCVKTFNNLDEIANDFREKVYSTITINYDG